MFSNFLTDSSQTELLRPQNVRMPIRLSTAEREAILAPVPRCNEWGPAAVPAAPEVAVGRGDGGRTVAQRSHLISRHLVAQEAIEEDAGRDALVCLPRRCLSSPKDQGGLGIQDLEVKNTALLGNWLF
jgi:hypothetical protein